MTTDPTLLASGVLNFFIDGGFFMIFLLLLSIVSLTVIILRGVALRRSQILPEVVEEAVQTLKPEEALDRVFYAVRDRPSALSNILAVLMEHLQWPKNENQEAVQTAARHEMARMESGLVILEITTGLAPILGLLGTLSGLVNIFANLGDGGDPVSVARGISEVLNTTIVGLSVAAPSLIAHNYFTRKIEVMAVEMESITADLMAKCYFPRSASAEEPTDHS